jgi:hypothetical protein
MYINLAQRAFRGELTVEVVNAATKEKLEEDKDQYGNTVLYCASYKCGIEVVEAILDKNVNIDAAVNVSVVTVAYYRLIVIKLTLFKN